MAFGNSLVDLHMKVFSKFVVKEVIPPMMISLVIFTFVFLMRTIIDLAEKLIEYQYTLSEIGRLLLFSIPAILGYVISMSLLLGIIVGLNRLSADSEVIAINSSGISSHSFLRPLMGIAVIACLVNAWLLAVAVPWANQEYGKIILDHSREVVSAEVRPRIFNEDFQGFIIYVNDVDEEDSSRWKQVFIFDQSDIDYPKAILALHADLLPRGEGGTLDLNMAVSHIYTFPRKEPGQPSAVSRAFNNTFHLIEEEGLEERREEEKDNRAKTIPELLSDIDHEENIMVFKAAVRNRDRNPQPLQVLMEVGDKVVAYTTIEIPQTRGEDRALEIPMRLPTGYEQRALKIKISQGGQKLFEQNFGIDDFAERHYSYAVARQIGNERSLELINSKLIRQKTNAYWIEIHKKFALPFTCIIFALLGLPLGLSSRRGGKAYGYVVGITIFILYWGLLTTGERLALYERVSPAVGIWMPNMIFGIAAILLLFLRRRAELRLPGLGTFLYRIKSQEPEQPDGEPRTAKPRQQRTSALSGTRADYEQVGYGFGFPLVLDRYLIKTFITMFVLVFVIVYAVFSLVSFIDINNDIQKNNVDQAIIIDYFQYVAPETIRWVIPISTLMGTMICFALLSKNSEVIAFKSSGVSIYRLSIPVVIMALLISVFAFINNDFLVPATAPRLAEIKGIIRNRPIQTTKDPRNRWVLGENKNRIYHFQLYDEDKRQIDELHIFDIEPESYELVRHIFVHQADWNGSAWEAREGWITTFSGTTRHPEEITATQSLPIPETPLYFGQEIKPSDQMNFAELADYIDNLEDYGFSTTRENFDLSWKLSFPFLPLVMTLLGLPFAFSTARRGGPLTGIFISIGLVIIFWGMMSLFRALGQTGLLPALLAAWAPNIAFLGVGVLLFFTLRS
jgi:LPS export ABC transporter permease LptG